MCYGCQYYAIDKKKEGKSGKNPNPLIGSTTISSVNQQTCKTRKVQYIRNKKKFDSHFFSSMI